MQMNKLKVIIEKYPDIWEYEHLFRAVLMDIYPEEKLIRNLLRVSVEERIPHQLKEMNQYSLVKRFELSKSMVEAYGCSRETADLIVDLWIEAFGLRSNNRPTNDEIARYSIEEIDLSEHAYNCLKRAGVNIVADVMRPRKEEPMLGSRTLNFSKRAYDELVRKIKELGWQEDDELYHEKNHPGREKCDKLREIRKKIADANNITFEPAECHHRGPCLGTCPKCDAEIRYLDRQLRLKKERGERIVLSGIAADEIKNVGFNLDPETDAKPDYIEGGLVEPGGIEDFWDIDVDLNKDNKDLKTDDFVMGELSPIVMGEDVFPDTDLEDIW